MNIVAFLVKPDNTCEWVVREKDKLFENTGIQYGERVNTQTTRTNNIVAVVDEDGWDKGMLPNAMGTLIAGYPRALAGPILILSERMEYDGMDFTTISPKGVEFIRSICERWKQDALFEFTWLSDMTPPEA